MKKVGKITQPFRYDLNQIPYDYTVEVTNRFKGLDLTECLKKYGLKCCTGGNEQNHPKARRQSGCLRRLYKWLNKEEKRKARQKGKGTLN